MAIAPAGVISPRAEPGKPVTPSEPAISMIFRLLAISFAVVGFIFLSVPDGTVRFINAVGQIFGVFQPAPESALRFWLSLGFSYMALVTVLAGLIQSDPRGYRHLMPVLAIGKFCSSFTCLLFFVFSSPAFLYFVNFLVDGSITLLVLGCYAWLGMAEEPASADRFVAGTKPILDAVIGTLLPDGGVFKLGGRETSLERDLWQYFAEMHGRGPLALALLLRGLDYGPYVFGPRPARFTRLSVPERERYLAGFERSRFAVRRQLLASLKLIAMLHFYDYPEVQRAVGYDGVYLREKLLAGPNAAHHRRRLQ